MASRRAVLTGATAALLSAALPAAAEPADAMALHEIIHEQGHWWVYTLEEHLARNCWCLVLSFRRPSTGTFVYDMVLYHEAPPDEAAVTRDLRRMQGNILRRLAPAETAT